MRDSPYVTITYQKNFTPSKCYLIINIFNTFFCSINCMFGCLTDLKFLQLALWKYQPLQDVPKNMYVLNIGKILEKNFSFHSNGDSNSVTTDTGGALWPNITPQKSLCCGVMMGNWPNFILVPAKLYHQTMGDGEPLTFLIFLELITVN